MHTLLKTPVMPVESALSIFHRPGPTANPQKGEIRYSFHPPLLPISTPRPILF